VATYVLPGQDVHTVLDDTNEEKLVVFERCETHIKRCFCTMRELRRRKFKDPSTVRVSINTMLLTRCLSWQVSSTISVVNFVQLIHQVFKLLRADFIISH